MIPTVTVEHCAEGTVSFYCEHCNEQHIHGNPERKIRGSLGHRVAHCLYEGSPYKDGGYYLELKIMGM